MKKYTLTLSLVVGLSTTALFFNGCKSNKPMATAPGAVEVSLPLSGKEYRTDKENFRAIASGKSPDLSTAKKIAMLNSKSEMASNIQSTLKKVADQYTNQVSVANKQEFENKFEELQREVVNQKLADIRIVGEKILKQTDGSYEYWLCSEMPKDAVLKSITSNERNKVAYDKKKYEEIFDQEMQKLENAQ